MYILYADDAGNTGTDYDNKQQPIFTLAGIIVEEGRWFELNEKVNALKKALLPDFPSVEIHAADIFSGKKDKRGHFNFRANTAEQNRAILESFIDLVVEEQLPILYFSVRKENLKRYCTFNFGGTVKIDPYLIAFPYITSFFDHFLSSRKERGLIMLDEQNSILTNIDTVFSRIRLNGTEESFHAANIIERALFVESSKSNFIQLADVCNFHINRFLSLMQGVEPSNADKKTYFWAIWQKILPLLVESPFDPYSKTDLFVFFKDNKEIFGKKEQPAP